MGVVGGWEFAASWGKPEEGLDLPPCLGTMNNDVLLKSGI
jgi:hypothetical protein